MSWKILGGPLWFQWARTLVFLLLFAEYMRLVLAIDVASYRLVVTAILAITFAVSLVSLVQTIRHKSNPDESQTL
jgi:ABC-type transport system involved in cytochrome c biogenesis permease subunit